MWQCASQAPGGSAYLGLTGLGSGPGIGFVTRTRLLRQYLGALDDGFPPGSLRSH